RAPGWEKGNSPRILAAARLDSSCVGAQRASASIVPGSRIQRVVPSGMHSMYYLTYHFINTYLHHGGREARYLSARPNPSPAAITPDFPVTAWITYHRISPRIGAAGGRAEGDGRGGPGSVGPPAAAPIGPVARDPRRPDPVLRLGAASRRGIARSWAGLDPAA